MLLIFGQTLYSGVTGGGRGAALGDTPSGGWHPNEKKKFLWVNSDFLIRLLYKYSY